MRPQRAPSAVPAGAQDAGPLHAPAACAAALIPELVPKPLERGAREDASGGDRAAGGEAEDARGEAAPPFDARDGKYGYCEIMYFADAYGHLEKHHRARFDQISPECPQMNATRTAQAWWLEKTLALSDVIPPNGSISPRGIARLNFGAEYGAAVLPKWIDGVQVDGRSGVRFRWLLSTWNPYRVVVMETDFAP